MPVRFFVTSGTVNDCKKALALIDGISAEYLLADRGYDTNEIIQATVANQMVAVIPSKANRIEQREYDKYLYRMRHLIENAFLNLKRWRGIATKKKKSTASFVAAVQIRCIDIWAKILS
jgi:transposase